MSRRRGRTVPARRGVTPEIEARIERIALVMLAIYGAVALSRLLDA